MVKMVARGFTAAADAYLTPHIMRYVLCMQYVCCGTVGTSGTSGACDVISGPALPVEVVPCWCKCYWATVSAVQ